MSKVEIHEDKECILCGRCLEVCPLFTVSRCEELSPRAKHQLAVAARDGQLPIASAKHLASVCLGCGRCETVCSQGLYTPDVVAALRAAQSGMQEWIWKTWIMRGEALWPALARLARYAPSRYAPKKNLVLNARAMRPRRRIDPWVTVHEGAQEREQDEPVAIFPGCLASRVRTDWVEKADLLLRRSGANLVPSMPEWDCCGITLGHAGLHEAEQTVRERNLASWRAAGRPRVVVFCATCHHGLLGYARDSSVDWEPGEQQRWERSILPLSSLLAGLRFSTHGKTPDRLLYHRPCHGPHGFGSAAGNDPDQALLRRIAGDALSVPAQGQCCGMGGVMQLGAPDMSRAVAASCWERHGARPGDQLVTGCSGCVIQLGASAPDAVDVGHWLDVIRLP